MNNYLILFTYSHRDVIMRHNLSVCPATMVFEQGGIIIVPRYCCDKGHRVYLIQGTPQLMVGKFKNICFL